MKALRLETWQSPAVLRDVAIPEPRPGEVLVQVGGAGACHSDLHLMHDFKDGQRMEVRPLLPSPFNSGYLLLIFPSCIYMNRRCPHVDPSGAIR